MKRRLRKLETSILFVLRVLLYGSLFLVFYLPYGYYNFQLYNVSRTTAVVIATYVTIAYMFSNIYGRYDVGKRKSKPIVHSLVLTMLFTDAFAILALSIMNTNDKKNDHFVIEQPQLILPIFLAQLLIILIFVYGGNKLYFTIYDPEDCIIVTSSQHSLNEIARGVSKYRLQYNVTQVADYRDKSLKDYIMQHDTVFVYDVPIAERTDIVEFCYQNMKSIYFNPDMHDVVEKSAKHFILDDVSMYGNYSKGLTLEQRAVKRVMDVIISIIAIIITSPIMLICAIAIKAEDHGKVIFKQNRVTRNGKIFSVFKFRTMKEDVENYAYVENDDRVTKCGRVLRKYRIDELPQFLNVLKGDMSVVGPRPEMLTNIFHYTNELPEFEYRLRVKAGITGYAQIAGKYNTSPKDKLILDLIYIEEYSFWQDIKLLFQTLIVLLKRDSTEGFHTGQELNFMEYKEAEAEAPVETSIKAEAEAPMETSIKAEAETTADTSVETSIKDSVKAAEKDVDGAREDGNGDTEDRKNENRSNG